TARADVDAVPRLRRHDARERDRLQHLRHELGLRHALLRELRLRDGRAAIGHRRSRQEDRPLRDRQATRCQTGGRPTSRHEFLTQPTDEVLESLWCLREEGRATLPALLKRMPEPDTEALVRQMAETKMVTLAGDQIELIGDGEARARTIVRCHRLAERLLHD